MKKKFSKNRNGKFNYMKNRNIILPYELATKDLTLQEIGTIFTLFAIQKMDESEVLKFSDNDEYLETVNDLLTKEFIKVSYDENDEMIMDIDLTDKESKPFWSLLDCDENNNPIYFHPSNQWPLVYKIRPTLNNMKIIWVDCSDKSLFVYEHDQYNSLEDAETTYKLLIESVSTRK